MMKRSLLALLLVLSLTGCATSRHGTPDVPPMHSASEFRDQPIAYVYDPFERFNRNMYKFNYYFDKYLFIPVVNAYEFVTPVFLQDRISTFYNNVQEIRNFTNSVFQLKGKEAGVTLGRFVTNSTIGLGGLFDPATKFGLERSPEDFGKTLGYWGVTSGPYLVLPILGPSSVRDTGGMAVDRTIRWGIYTGVKDLADADSGDAFTANTIIQSVEAVDARHRASFRYYESGYPFEYYIVRFLYHEKRELEATKHPPEETEDEKRPSPP